MSVGIELGFSNDEVLSARFPLHRACRDGDVRALSSLLQRPGEREQLQAEDSFYGWTPIHWAAHFGKLECVLRLVQVGSEVNAMTTRFSQTPAHIAAFGGHPECLVWLLQAGADINRQDYMGEAPIHKAARADGTIEIATGLSNGHTQQKSFERNGHCHPHQLDTLELGSNMCGSLHLSGSPSTCMSHRPLWATFSSDFSDHLHYGHYHGFGDTAEDLDEAGTRQEHITTVKLEQHYNQEVLNAMQLFHGS